METVARGFELRGQSSGLGRYCTRVLSRAYAPLSRAENALLRMRNLAATADQLLFFALADRLLLLPPANQRMSGLYTLVFYNVIAYCLGYARDLLAKRDWTRCVTVAETSRVKHLAMSALKIGLEWTKAVTFLVTVACGLLVLGLQQRLDHHHYRPSAPYLAVTWAYYMATERLFADMLPALLGRLDALESLEQLYAPLVLRLFTISLSALFALALLPFAPLRFLFLAAYFNVFLRSKEFAAAHWPALQRERLLLMSYRHATAEEVRAFDDVCAVCLCPMRGARVTPCRHLFHAACLRLCVKSSDHCPMCKRQLAFS